jgi:hypothetical protein
LVVWVQIWMRVATFWFPDIKPVFPNLGPVKQRHRWMACLCRGPARRLARHLRRSTILREGTRPSAILARWTSSGRRE